MYLPDSIPCAIGDLTVGPSPTTGNGWEVRVRKYSDFHTLLAFIPRFTSLQFSKLLSDKGAGTIVMNLDDPVFSSTLGDGSAGTALLDYENLWQVYQNGILRFEFLGETVTEQLVDNSEQRMVTVTGPGTIATLAWAAAMPPGFPNIIFKTDAIQDGFAEVDATGAPALDTNLWNLATPLDHITLNPSGTCQLTASPSGTYLGCSPFDITSSSISAQITPMWGGSLDHSQLTQFYVQDPANSGNYALIGISGGTFYCKVGDTAAGTTLTKDLGGYDSNGDAYWRLSEYDGVFYFWTSSDGQTWAKKWTCAHSWSAADIDFYISAKYDVDNSQKVQVTNLNGDVITPSSAGNIYIGTPIMGAWKQIFDAAQARKTIPFVTTALSKTTDSFGNPWTDSVSVQIANGTDLYSLLQSHAATVNAEWVMQPGFVLQVGLPVTPGQGISIGSDRSKSVLVREAYNELTKQRVRARDAIANLVAAVNSNGRVVSYQDNSSIGQYWQREGWVETATQVNSSSMQIVVQASVDQTKDEKLSWTLDIVPDTPGSTVFEDYDVGDWVGLERPGAGTDATVDAVRVIGAAVSIDATGMVTCELTLNSYRQWLAEQLQYLVNKFGGQFINTLGTTPVTSNAASPQGFPVVTAPDLGGLSNVSTNGVNNGDPLVYNAATGTWQNASQNSVGLAIGSPSGSQVSLRPSVGDTVQLGSGGVVATIASAYQMQSGAGSETNPAYISSIVLNAGASNEQLGHLTVSGFGANTAQAVLMLSQAADGSQLGGIQHGTITGNGSTSTYLFRPLIYTWPNSSEHVMGDGIGMYGVNPNTGASTEGWHNLVGSNGFNFTVSGEYHGAYRYVPLHTGMVMFRGAVTIPSSADGKTCSSVPSGYWPGANARWTVRSLTNVGRFGYCVLNPNGSIVLRWPSTNSETVDITGSVHL